MFNRQLANVVREMRRRSALGAEAATDRALLDRYVADRDEAAFTALVERHGNLVLNVCRRVLPSSTDADDVCQAVFLVLARKAAGIRNKDALGAWLHGTAYRLAANLRRQLARRRRREQPLAVEAATIGADPGWREVRGVLDEELHRLPETLRLPLLLCYLEGQTRDEAARCLGWTVGTLRGRLERGRTLLRGRLARRGLDLSAALLAALLTENVLSAALPATQATALAQAALAYASGAARGAASAHAVALAEGVMHAMFLEKIKVLAVCLVLGLLVLGGAAMTAAPWPDGAKDAAKPDGVQGAAAKPADEVQARPAWRSLGNLAGLDALGAPRFSADGTLLIALDGTANCVQLRDPHSGALKKSIPVKGMQLVDGFAVSADGSTIAVRGATFHGYFVANRLVLIDARSGEAVQIVANDVRSDDKRAYPARLAISPDGRRVAWSTEFDHRLLVWERTTNKIKELPTPNHWPSSLAFAPDSKALVCAVGAQLRFFDADGKETRTVDVGVYGSAMAFTPDGKSLAVAGIEWVSESERDRVHPVVCVLDVDNPKVRKTHRAKTSVPTQQAAMMASAAARQATQWVVTNDRATNLIVWDLLTGGEEVLLRDEKSCRAAIAPDGTTLAVVRRQAAQKHHVLSLWRRGGK